MRATFARYPWRRLVAAIIGSISLPAAAQTTWLVSNEPGENPDFASLEAAIASPLVLPGDTIEISEGIGTYLMGADVTKQLTIRAEPGETPVISPSGNLDRPAILVKTFGPQGVVIEGLTFQKLAVNRAAIIALSQHNVIRDCVFHDFGGAVACGGFGLIADCLFLDGVPIAQVVSTGFNSVVEDCLFVTTNPSTNTGFLIRAQDSTVRSCRFVGGPVCRVGDGVEGDTVFESCIFESATLRPDQTLFFATVANSYTFESCVFANLTTSQPLIGMINLDTTLRACTVARCEAPSLVSYVLPGHAASVDNSILWDNTIPTLFVNVQGTVTWSIVQSLTAGVNNVVTNPLFRDPDAGDFSLKRGSPAVDSGDSSLVPSGVTLDAAGNPRRVDDPAMPDTGSGFPVVDRGAYEFQPPGPGFCQADLTTTAVPGSPGYGIPNGIVNNDDFFYYLSVFASGLGCGNFPGSTTCPSPPDLTTTAIPGTPGYGLLDGNLSNDDFFYYLAIFAAGC